MFRIKRNLNFSDKNYELVHLLFLISVLIFLLILSSFHRIGGFNVETDFYGSYAPNVKNILQGGRYYDEDHGPGYIFPLTVLSLICGDIFTAAKLLSIISTVLFLLFTFLTIKALYNRKLALFSSIMLFIIIVRYSILASTDMFFAFVISLSIYLIFRSGELTTKNLIFGGLAAGYALMTRLNAVIIPVSLFFSLIFINSPDWDWRKRLKIILYFTGAVIVGSLPWYVMNIIYYGKPLISAAHQTIGASLLSSKSTTSGDFAWGIEKAKVAKQYDSLLSLIVSNFPLIFKTILKNIPTYFQWMLSYLIGFPGYLFVAPGIIFAISRANKIQLSFLTIPLFGFLIYAIVSFIPRFYIYIMGYFTFFIAYFLLNNHHVSSKTSYRKRFRLLSYIALVLIICFSALKSKFYMTQDFAREPRYITRIAQIIKSQSNENDIILARKPHIGYFSNRKIEPFPQIDNVKDLITYCRQKGVRFIYYGIIEAQLRPELSVLQHPDQLPEGLTLIYKQNNPNQYLYRVE